MPGLLTIVVVDAATVGTVVG
eukprot:COSAG06_NODE_8819_length_2063_cov_1.989308_4_plen_20_part_01